MGALPPQRLLRKLERHRDTSSQPGGQATVSLQQVLQPLGPDTSPHHMLNRRGFRWALRSCSINAGSAREAGLPSKGQGR